MWRSFSNAFGSMWRLVWYALASLALLFGVSYLTWAEEKPVTLTQSQWLELNNLLEQYKQTSAQLKQQNQELNKQLTIAQESLKTSEQALTSSTVSTTNLTTYLQESSNQTTFLKIYSGASTGIAVVSIAAVIVESLLLSKK